MTDETLPTIAPRDKITAEYIRARLAYDPDTGVFVWRHCDAIPKNWNARFAGAVAGTFDCLGYRRIKIDGTVYLAHRFAWLITHGEWPAADIDHINGDTSDNRLANLRVVNHSGNMRNQAVPSNNTSGHIGVTWHKASGKWAAQIKADGIAIFIGTFTDISDAIAARAAAEISHGFHPNHGRTHHR